MSNVYLSDMLKSVKYVINKRFNTNLFSFLYHFSNKNTEESEYKNIPDSERKPYS